MADFGVSFLPTLQTDPQQGGLNAVEPTQSAVQFRSLRLPKVLPLTGSAEANKAFGVANGNTSPMPSQSTEDGSTKCVR